MRKTLAILLLISTHIHAGLYEDYISGHLETWEMLTINPDIIQYEGPMQSHMYTNGTDYGYTYYPSLGTIPDNVTQFLSFELNTHNFFEDSDAHFVATLRGPSDTSNPNNLILRGRGLALGETSGAHYLGCDGIAIEDFATRHYPPYAGNNDPNFIKGCIPFQFQNYSTYRIDVHASKNSVAYFIFKYNPSYYWVPGSPRWLFQVASGCGQAPYNSLPCTEHPNESGYSNIILGGAFLSAGHSFSVNNVYTATFQ